MTRVSEVDGFGLVVAMLVLVALYGLGAAIVPLATTETLIAANHRRAVQMLYAAEAGAERALDELRDVSDWSLVLAGRRVSSLPPTHAELRLADGRRLDLKAPNVAPAMDAGGRTDDNASRWRLFLDASFDELVDRDVTGVLRVAVWVADDPSDGDGDPTLDSNRTLVVHAACFGPGLAQRAVRVTARRRAAEWVEAVSWATMR